MYVGVYGFEFNKPIRVESAKLELIPIGKTDKEIKSLAKDKHNFNLTGFIEIAEKHSLHDEKKIWVISSLLTFCQQQWVIVSYSPFKKLRELPPKLNLSHQYRTIGNDLLFNDHSKEKLLNLLYSKLQDDEFIASTDFKTAFYRNVELWRLNLHFMDVTYYFCFSGIEALARCKFNDYDSSTAFLVTCFLKDLGFNVTQDEMQDFTHVRNALFHYGAKSKTVNKNGKTVELTLSDFEDKIIRLFPDILLKVVGFEDGHINWNRWKDLMG